MKKAMKCFITLFVVMLILCSSSVTANAETMKPIKPNGLALYNQEGKKVTLQWNYDKNLPNYSDIYPGYFGYEVVVTTLKGKKIAVLDEYTNVKQYKNISECFYKFNIKKNGKGHTVSANVSNNKLKTQGFKFKVRTYVFDKNQQKVYSDYSAEKIIIPRAAITKTKLVSEKSTKIKITWKKVTGAKNYTVYITSDNGKKFKKVGKTSKNSIVTKKLKKDTEYYVYVQVNGVKYQKKAYKSTNPVKKLSNCSEQIEIISVK